MHAHVLLTFSINASYAVNQSSIIRTLVNSHTKVLAGDWFVHACIGLVDSCDKFVTDINVAVHKTESSSEVCELCTVKGEVFPHIKQIVVCIFFKT